ncbi:fibrobacter succinogenes major paralogous domain-containing protein [Echinicola rosea]|uniref:Fibrobacter succinogenes major paralogous domain-containing protein n=1 Tax=Echinicola rosea TaxID=1807691 RepID=A0ABQ1USY9_9BACT|nr:fibrobacter succinogenes major paralogous domain-containing protein [Echinicola rosea]GGF24302.1 hypothetical protein GCM10011339_10500 [Echinicola rosea]
MKKSIFAFFIVLFLIFGCTQETIDHPLLGTASFSKIVFDDLTNYSPNSKVASNSEWKHIFKESAILVITNKATGQVYNLEYNPNDFTKAYQIQLPLGTYSFKSEVMGGDFETYLPFNISGEFNLDGTNVDITLHGTTEYGLVTVKNEFVQRAFLNNKDELIPCDQGELLYLYVKEGLAPTLTIYENFHGQSLIKQLSISSYNHYHFYLKVFENQGTVNFIELAIGPFEYHEDYFEIGRDGEITKVTDAGGNEYRVVKIGEQYWMAEDLKSQVFCNGDSLQLFSENTFTRDLSFSKDTFGVAHEGVPVSLYSDAVATDPRNICPCGWHISTDDEWKELERIIGMPEEEVDLETYNRGSQLNLSGKLKKISNDESSYPDVEWLWFDNEYATDEYGFSSLPRGRMLDYGDEITSTFVLEIVAEQHSVRYASFNNEDPENIKLFTRTLSLFWTGIGRRNSAGQQITIRCVKN